MELIIPLLIIIAGGSLLQGWLGKSKTPGTASPLQTGETKHGKVGSNAGNDFQLIQQKIVYFLNNNDIKYNVTNQGTLYNMTFGAEKAEVELFIRIDREGGFVKFNSLLYPDIPDSKMMKVAELATRLNENMILGHFNVFYDLRMAAYESVIVLFDLELTSELLQLYMTYCKKASYDYRPLFKRVIENDEEPLLAVISFHNQPETNPNVSTG